MRIISEFSLSSCRKYGLNRSRLRTIFLIVLTAVVLIGCQPTNTPSKTFSLGEVVFQDDFSSPYDWDNRSAGRVQIGVDDGAYRMRSDSTAYVRGFNNEVHENVLIEVETLQLTSPENNAYGIVCRASPSDTSSNGYYFLIGGDGSYSIRKGRGGNVEPLINWARTDTINRGVAHNVIRVLCVDNYLALYINGEFVAETYDDSFQSGFLGFALATSADTFTEVAFDNLTVWSASINP